MVTFAGRVMTLYSFTLLSSFIVVKLPRFMPSFLSMMNLMVDVSLMVYQRGRRVLCDRVLKHDLLKLKYLESGRVYVNLSNLNIYLA